MRICPLYLPEFILSKKKVDPAVTVLLAHQKATLVSYNNISWISLGASADPNDFDYLLDCASNLICKIR